MEIIRKNNMRLSQAEKKLLKQSDQEDGANIILALQYLLKEASREGHQEIYDALELALNLIFEENTTTAKLLMQEFSNSENAKIFKFLLVYLNASPAAQTQFLDVVEHFNV